jgi:hypothetical protein
LRWPPRVVVQHVVVQHVVVQRVVVDRVVLQASSVPTVAGGMSVIDRRR